MPQGSTYLDQLAILNEQDFLGGAAKVGKAVKERKQNQTLVDLWNKFNADKTELKTTLEQQGEFNKHLSSVDMEDGEEAPAEISAFVDFMGTIDEMGAYANLYQPFITAMATLGEDGVKAASTLSNELATQLQLSEAKGNVPLRQLEYQALVQDFNWTRDKYDSWAKDETLRRDSMEASEYILNAPVFDLIEGGDITTASSERLKKHNIAIKSVVDNAFEHFGGKLSKGAIIAGLKLAMDNSGKSFSFNDIALMSKGAGTAITDLELQGYNSLLRGWSSNWINMNPQLRQAVKDYMSGGTLPDTELAKIGQAPDPDEVKRLAEIYRPEGAYMTAYSTVTGLTPGYVNFAKDESGLQIPTLAGTEDIIRPYGNYGFVNGEYVYNPYERVKLLKQLRNEKQDRVGGSLYDVGFDGRGFGTEAELESWGRLYELEQKEKENKGKLPPNSPLLNIGK